MLANSLIFDAHFHLFDCFKGISHENLIKCCSFFTSDAFCGMNCCLSLKEFNELNDLLSSFSIEKNESNLFHCAGLHPWNVKNIGKNIDEKIFQIKNLLASEKISAIGECGLDFYDEELKSFKESQFEAFEKQLLLAIEFKKPIVLHLRKAFLQLEQFFPLLKQVPSVLFHGFSGGPNDVVHILKSGINGFFSFGYAAAYSKKAVESLKIIPKDRILMESDFSSGKTFEKGKFFSLEEYIERQEKLLSFLSGYIFDEKEDESHDFASRILKKNFMLYLKNE